MTKNLRSFILGLVLLTAISSCTPLKDIVYLQEAIDKLDTSFVEPPIYYIQPNDFIYIKFITSDEASSRYLNALTGSTSNTYMNTSSSIVLNSFKVSLQGNLDLPGVGKIQVKGKTLQEIEELIKTEISKYLEDATVIVKQVSKTFTVMGEVSRPGTYSFDKDNLTFFEALGYANDLTDYSNRHNIKIIRNNNNKKEIVELDLTNINILNSPFYYILPNDVIYIEPRTGTMGSKSFSYSTAITTLSTAILIYNTFIKQ